MKAGAELGSVTAAAVEASVVRKLRREKDVSFILLRLSEVTEINIHEATFEVLFNNQKIPAKQVGK
jgi:hypothetical protein